MKKNNFSKKKPLLIGSLILIIGLIFLGYLVLGQEVDDKIESQKISTERIFSVKTLSLGEGQQEVKLERTVIVQSDASAMAIAEYSGRIREVKFKTGDKVYKNQVLAVFDQSTMKNSAKVVLDSSQNNLEIASENLKKTQKLIDENLKLAKNSKKIAEIQFEKAKNNYKEDKTSENKFSLDLAERQLKGAKYAEDQAEQNAKLQLNGAILSVNQAKTGLDQAQIGYEATLIRAPINGTVVLKSVKKDDYLNAGMIIAQIVGEGKLQTNSSLNVDQLKKINEQGEFEFEINNHKYKANLDAIAPIASGFSQRFELRVSSQEDLAIFSNQSARLFIPLRLETENSFFIPLSAVNIGQKKTVVFVVVNGVAKIREVQTGVVIGEKIEITQGLSLDEVIVVENARSLIDGARVELIIE